MKYIKYIKYICDNPSCDNCYVNQKGLMECTGADELKIKKTTGESGITHINLVKKIKEVNKKQELLIREALECENKLKEAKKQYEKSITGIHNKFKKEIDGLYKVEGMYPVCKQEYEDDYPIFDMSLFSKLSELVGDP